jgi:hypothetical protein
MSIASDMVIHVSDETNLWNRLALALSRGEQHTTPQVVKMNGELNDLLNHYEVETKEYHNIYQRIISRK